MTATWTAPRTWADAELVTAALLNTHIRDNFDYVLNPNVIYVKNTSATDFTTTSTSFVAVDATLSVSITTHGGHLLIGATFNMDATTGTQVLAFDVDGTQHYQWAPNENPTPGSPDYRGNNHHVVLLPSSVISSAAHTVALKWKTSAGTATMYNDFYNTFFWAVEI